MTKKVITNLTFQMRCYNCCHFSTSRQKLYVHIPDLHKTAQFMKLSLEKMVITQQKVV